MRDVHDAHADQVRIRCLPLHAGGFGASRLRRSAAIGLRTTARPGAVRKGSTAAPHAGVDPETLTHSKAAPATALVRQGLVAEAVRGGGDGLPLLGGVTRKRPNMIDIGSESWRFRHGLTRTKSDLARVRRDWSAGLVALKD